MREAYAARPDVAHRLQAARKAAGFASARKAALTFGWSLPTYRAHEAASRQLGKAAAGEYAKAFGVTRAWLLDNKGSGKEPEIDAEREKRFADRETKVQAAAKDDPKEQAGRRLRLARRLAGYRSVAGGAAAVGVPRTTLSGHESAENRISADAGRIYAGAFGVHPEWLLSGALPSGLGTRIEHMLSDLLTLHDEREAKAAVQLAGLRETPPPSPTRTRKKKPLSRAAAGRKPVQDTIPEITAKDLRAALEEDSLSDARAEQLWSFPRRYLDEVADCSPRCAIVVASPRPAGAADRGERLILDTAAARVFPGASFVAIHPDGTATVLESRERTVAPTVPQGALVAGRICGYVAVVRKHPTRR